ncbi:MAG TPA: 4Fe-4S dicluster domain-containing protein [Chloroflexi bacterium]|nr:4Fe-4S dicluster domain-containing protein [Chloroflexota bacterium]
MTRVNSKFIDDIKTAESFNASACMNCGVCTAICPMGLDLLPRRLFRYVVIGVEEKVLENQETIFSCLMCKMCEQNCPAKVDIVENVRTLRRYINRKVFGFSRN